MSRKMKLDFTGVESYLKASEGEHAVKIAAADLKQSQGGNDMVVVQFEVMKGDDKGARVFENYPLIDTALWKLKGLLQAIGMKADGKVQLDLDKLIGKTCTIVVIHEEYEGKIRARVDEVKKLNAAATSDDDEDEDEEDLPFSEDDDEEEDEAEEPEEKPTKKKAKAAAKKEKAPINPPADEDEDDDDDWDEDEDDEEEEEEEKPAPKKKAAKKEEKPAKKAPAKKGKSKAEEEDDEDDDWDDDDWDE